MAKQKPEKWRVEFVGSGEVFENVQLIIVPKPEQGFHFLNIDKKPNGWIMLVTEGFLHDHDGMLWPMDVHRSQGDPKPQFLVRNGCPCPVSRYISLSAFQGREFYHLDQLNDGTFRIAHSLRAFHPDFKHSDVQYINFVKEA